MLDVVGSDSVGGTRLVGGAESEGLGGGSNPTRGRDLEARLVAWIALRGPEAATRAILAVLSSMVGLVGLFGLSRGCTARATIRARSALHAAIGLAVDLVDERSSYSQAPDQLRFCATYVEEIEHALAAVVRHNPGAGPAFAALIRSVVRGEPGDAIGARLVALCDVLENPDPLAWGPWNRGAGDA